MNANDNSDTVSAVFCHFYILHIKEMLWNQFNFFHISKKIQIIQLNNINDNIF